MSDVYKATEVLIREKGVRALVREKLLDVINLVPVVSGAETEIELSEEQKIHLKNVNESSLKECEGLTNKAPWMKHNRVFAVNGYEGVFLLPGVCSDEVIQEEVQNALTVYPFQSKTTNNVGPDLPPNPFDGKPALRWVSLGCIYAWSERCIVSTGKLPEPLAQRALDVAKLVDGKNFSSFRPDCALVNYYQKGDRLRGHRDDVEESTEMPLITFSFGQSALFLLGCTTRMEKPICLALHEGDVLVMSGPSRQNFHGVPQLVTYVAGKQSTSSFSSDVPMSPRSFRQRYRVNISVRQK